MYAKANYRNNESIVIPQNYSGNAFMKNDFNPQNEQEPCLDSAPCLECDTKEPSKQEHEQAKTEHTDGGFIASLLPPKISEPSGIFGNIGLEEMLILGVLILLSQSESDNDILLLLFLLLFYK